MRGVSKDWAAALCLFLAGCAGQPVYDPVLGVYVGRDGQVDPSVSGAVGGVSVGAGSGGGYVSTGFGPIRLGAGF